MCPRTSKQFEEIRINKRRQIIDAAIECFATTGYHAVSISDLAKHAGISKGLMYNYFPSKDDLLRTIFREVMDEMMKLIGTDGHGITRWEELTKYFRSFISDLKSNLIMWKMYMSIFSQPAVQQILAEEIILASKEPMEMLERFFRNQGYKNPAVEVAFLSTLMSGITWEYIADPENYPLENIKERIISIYSTPHPPTKK